MKYCINSIFLILLARNNDQYVEEMHLKSLKWFKNILQKKVSSDKLTDFKLY